MSKIDLSKAKIGDKFRTKNGLIMTYCKRTYVDGNFHILSHNDGSMDVFYKNGNYLKRSACELDLAEQVFDDEKDTTDLLQRRQEVVKLADRIFFSERGSAYSFKECIEVAEHSVNMINQYLKEGKL